MKKVGLIGLGDMGIGMAKNIVKNGFELTGFDLREERRQILAELGGKPAASCREVAENSDAVFVMVLNGKTGARRDSWRARLIGRTESGFHHYRVSHD